MTGFGWAVAVASAFAVAGGLWRAAGWLRLGLPAVPPPVRERIGSLLASLGRGPRVERAWRATATLLLDVLAQRRLWLRDPVRWAAHLLLFVGFTGLCVLHALGDVVTVRLAAIAPDRARSAKTSLPPQISISSLTQRIPQICGSSHSSK